MKRRANSPGLIRSLMAYINSWCFSILLWRWTECMIFGSSSYITSSLWIMLCTKVSNSYMSKVTSAIAASYSSSSSSFQSSFFLAIFSRQFWKYLSTHLSVCDLRSLIVARRRNSIFEPVPSSISTLTLTISFSLPTFDPLLWGSKTELLSSSSLLFSWLLLLMSKLLSDFALFNWSAIKILYYLGYCF